jgi:hypothetical protein
MKQGSQTVASLHGNIIAVSPLLQKAISLIVLWFDHTPSISPLYIIPKSGYQSIYGNDERIW